MTVTWAAVGALLAGLLAYGLFQWLLWDVPISALGSLVGLAAIVGGALGGWWARRRAAARPADAPPRTQGPA